MQKSHFTVLILFLFSGVLLAQKAPDLSGNYRLPNGLDVKLYKTGDTWSGKIISLNNFGNHQTHDIKNPDKARRQDPLIGKVIIRGLKYDSKKKEWNGGTMYAPEKGMEFNLMINNVRKEGVEVVGSKFVLRKTLFWKRI